MPKKKATKKRTATKRASVNAIPGKWTSAKVRRVGRKAQIKFIP